MTCHHIEALIPAPGGAPRGARWTIRAAILGLAGLGLLTIWGMIASAREPYGGPLEA
jgi:hypothetical protein